MSGSPLGPRPMPHPALLSPTSPHAPDSFLYLLHSDSGRPLFFEHLRTGFSEHHLLFWEQVQHYKRSHQPPSPTHVRTASEPPLPAPLDKARSIHTRFILTGAPLQINITEQARTRITAQLAACDAAHPPPPHLFDESEMVCVELMKGNYFYSFKETADYAAWLATEKKAHGKKAKGAGGVHSTKRKQQHRLCVIL